MQTSYTVHRRINAPVEFQGLKAQYIVYALGIVIADLFLFAILFIAGASQWICLLLCLGMGMVGVGGCYRFSHRYGVSGWRKRQTAKKLPKALRAKSRRPYFFEGT